MSEEKMRLVGDVLLLGLVLFVLVIALTLLVGCQERHMSYKNLGPDSQKNLTTNLGKT